MDIRIYEYVAIFLFAVFLKDYKEKGVSIFINLIFLILILESALRSLYVGPDTGNYWHSFNDIKSMGWHEVFKNFVDVYQYGEGKDAGYKLIVKVLQIPFDHFQSFLTFNAFLFYIPLAKLLKRYFNDILSCILAFVLFIALFRIIALSGIRQMLATALCNVVFLSLLDGHYKRCIVIILLSSTIHISALFYLPILFLSKMNFSSIRRFHIIALLVSPIVLLSAQPIVKFLVSFIANDYYENYAHEMANTALTYLILMEGVSIFCYVAFSTYANKDNHSGNAFAIKLLYTNLPMLSLLVPLVMLDTTMIRIGQYFTIYTIILLPYSLNLFCKTTRTTVYLIVILILALLTFKAQSEYSFFWQLDYKV